MQTRHGTIDVHRSGPDSDPPFFRATVVVDSSSFAREEDPLPSWKQLQDVLLKEFEVGDNHLWEIGIHDRRSGREIRGGAGVYID